MMQETTNTNSPVAAADNGGAPSFSVGRALRDAREAAGLSTDDVANRLKFSPRQISALEDDDFGKLPEMAFVRGFVRSYARLLQLDEESLLGALPGARVAAAPALEAKHIDQPFHSVYAQLQPNIKWIAGALGIVVVLVLFIALRDGKEPEPKPAIQIVEIPQSEPASAVAPAAPGEQVANATVPATPAGPVAGLMPTPVAAAPVAPAAPATNSAPKPHDKEKAPAKPRPEHVKPAKPAVVPAAVEAASGVSEAPEAARVATPEAAAPSQAPEAAATSAVAPAGAAAEPQAAAKARLHFVFDEDSWVEVKDGEGKTVYSTLGLRGHEQSLYRVPPFSVTIGHASGVRLYYKGKQVNLVPHTRTDVAHLTLE